MPGGRSTRYRHRLQRLTEIQSALAERRERVKKKKKKKTGQLVVQLFGTEMVVCPVESVLQKKLIFYYK